MSTVLIQVGQCGNQVGEALLDTLHVESACQGNDTTEYAKQCYRHFFTTSSPNGPKIANAVLVDMESKVVNKCLSAARAWCYDPRACVTAKQGSGNNWANGYYHYGGEMEEAIIDAIRVITNQIPHISTVLILMSCAGGTGSGLGCKITEIIRDMLPGALLLNQVVLPFSQGEVSVQVYNMLLTLATLNQHTDSILLTHNDQYQTLARRLIPSGAKHSTSFSEMNRLISSHLSGILLPSYQLQPDHPPDTHNPPGTHNPPDTHNPPHKLPTTLDQVLEHLVPHPAYKLLSNRMMPVISEYSRDFTHTSWEMLAKYSRQMLLQNSILDEGLLWSIKPRSELTTRNKNATINTCMSNYVVCRGAPHALPEVEQPLQVEDMYYQNNPKCLVSYNSAKFDKLDRCLFAVTNAAQNAAFLEDVLVDAWRKFNAKAFLYQYQNFGLGEDGFKDCFYIMEKVNQDYSNLSS